MSEQQADDLDIPSDADIITGRYMTAIRQGQNQVEEGLMSMEKTLRDDLVAVDINAPQELNLQQFTPEQINDFCKSARLLCDFNKMPSLVVALQIIRQLQAELQEAGDRLEGEGLRP